jgi:hypothetical protein
MAEAVRHEHRVRPDAFGDTHPYRVADDAIGICQPNVLTVLQTPLARHQRVDPEGILGRQLEQQRVVGGLAEGMRRHTPVVQPVITLWRLLRAGVFGHRVEALVGQLL